MKNEADTRATLIEPKLKAAGWREPQLTREFQYQRDLVYTEGRVILEGEQVRRGPKRRVDILLRLSEALPIAVVEAKAESEPAISGLEQAKRYARELRLPFAYATNGRDIIEFDFLENFSRDLDHFPSPQELYHRWLCGALEVDPASWPSELEEDPLRHPYCPASRCGKRPRYFQEIAIREAIARIVRGRRRILLTMATGTGKTFVAFQIVWKLLKSGWLQRRHPDRPARVLFLADRVVLRDQAYNAFGPLADGTDDPRCRVEGRPLRRTRDVYFAIYQTLWSEGPDGRRLFEEFPPDFFDLVIIDECHRSGFGTWREILDHFGDAIHLGLTATPKRDDNVDTYAYFCAEEPEVPIDPDDPGKGTWRPPAFQYSLGQGIEDGFLATYRVHLVRTTVDKDGLRLQDAIEQGAEVFVPEEAEVRDVYTTPDFEREITVPDRTETMVKHLAGLLRSFGPRDKTMVFCVTMEHARLVAKLLQNELGTELRISDYAVPIVSEEGEDGRRALERFASSDHETPVVATTVDLLTTGVDVPSCRNIVFMRTVSSPVVFKQIVGRGSRIDPVTDKRWFRIIDYTGATRLFDEWDRPPVEPPEAPSGPLTAAIEGTVFHAETEEPIPGASVSVLIGPNNQRGPVRTDAAGCFRFHRLPEGEVRLRVNATGFAPRSIGIATVADTTVTVPVPLKPARRRAEKIKVEGIEVTIAEEALFTIEATGQHLTLQEYRNHTRGHVQRLAPSREDLRAIWIDDDRRRRFLGELRRHGISPRALALALGRPDLDDFDLLAHAAFGGPLRTREERVIMFRNRERDFVECRPEDARRVILELLDKYRAGGIDELRPEIFRVEPFGRWGGAVKIARRFGGPDGLATILREIKRRLYAEGGTW